RSGQRLEEANERANLLAQRVEELESVAASSAGYASRIAEQDATIESLHAALEDRSREVGSLAARLESMENELAPLRTQLTEARTCEPQQGSELHNLAAPATESHALSQQPTDQIEQERQARAEVEAEMAQLRAERDEAIVATAEISRITA